MTQTPAGPRKLSFFSSVLGWSRFRTVSFSCSERFGALAVGLAHSFEQVGGVPGRVRFDNPKTVATGHLAGAAVLNPDLVRLAAHYRFSPRTTERQDPESKGKVEALVRFTKSDLIPYEGFGSLDQANQASAEWCAEVNGEVHYETRVRPAERLEIERPLFRALPAARPAVACGEERKVDRLATVRFVSARYSVPHRLVGEIVQVAASDRDVVIMFRGVPVAQHALLADQPLAPPPSGAGLTDQRGDQSASVDNKLTYTLNLTQCLASLGTSWDSGEASIHFSALASRPGVGAGASQSVWFKRP